MTDQDPISKSVFFTPHALQRMKERGVTEESVLKAITIGQQEPARGSRTMYRLNLEFKKHWDGKYYGVQQVAPVVREDSERITVITVYTFYFQEGDKP